MSKFFLAPLLLTLACTEAPVPSEQIAQMEQTLCANGGGVPSAMAALAVATATELRRWEPSRDFRMSRGFLALSRQGQKACADGRCWNTQAVLDLQRADADAVTLGDTLFDAEGFRSELEANFRAQRACESRGDSRGNDSCTAEQHELTLESSSSGACDTLFTFKATTPSGQALTRPGQLRNKLIYVGYPENEYLSFSSTSSSVSIDPTLGLNDSDATSTGSCAAACTKISLTNVSGECCSCGGVTKTFVRSTFSSVTYLCT
jgi:hypothetical protein